MPAYENRLAELGVPGERPIETLDARELPPPEPLCRSLERLAELVDDTVLVQFNDRVPQHLFPRLDDRGYEYAADEGDPTLTAIWRADG